MPWRAVIVSGASGLLGELELSLCTQFPVITKRCVWPDCEGGGLPLAHPDFIVVSTPENTDSSNLLFHWIQRRAASVPCLAVLPNLTDRESMLSALETADDFLVAPLRVSELIWRVRRLLNLREPQQRDATRRLSHEMGLAQIITRDPGFRKLIERLAAFSRAQTPVLLRGETGTGKELCARALHHLSPRSSGPFVPVDCGTIPDHLIENELFGHARGAFTDAHADQRGLVTLANNGTLFLDEIDSLSLIAQAKLLRFIQEGAYRPLGNERLLRADVRIVAATNGDLEGKIQSREFRPDLYYRLNVLSCRLPPLRERSPDVGLLAQHFLDELSCKSEHRSFSLSPGAVRLLESYSWPGNVRELFNLMQRVVALLEGPLVLPDKLAALMSVPPASEVKPIVSFREERERVLESFDRRYLENLLRIHYGNVTQAARYAGKDRRVLGRLLKKYAIDRSLFAAAGPESPTFPQA